ncbi:hypothetical protein ACET3X_007954 [Alternaria dauci]|uniref:C3H1-type domain-containing protein n=1 Tax=Alternaria dauci TaxID=48095 RepID=A0ABR3UEX1_9PLEO
MACGWLRSIMENSLQSRKDMSLLSQAQSHTWRYNLHYPSSLSCNSSSRLSSSVISFPYKGLRYYLLRSDAMGGSIMAPLVPVDQLPFQLQGVPRQLTHRQISDEGWKLCSETNEVPSALAIQAPTTTSFPPYPSTNTKPRYLAPDHHVRAVRQTLAVDYCRPTRSSHESPTVAASPEQHRPTPSITPKRPSSLIDTFASIYQKDAQRLGYCAPYPSGIEPDPSKKEYCTHWIKTGECDWTAVGCKFKHEMPSIEKLRELGFARGIPRWWKEKSAIVARPPTWMQRRLAGNEDAEYAGEMPEPRAFPDPSTFRARRAEGRDLLDEEVQQPRSILKRDVSLERTTAGRLTPPSELAQQPIRRANHTSDLLIDLDDTPTPPHSPHLCYISEVSAGSSESHVPSSSTSASPPPSPTLDRNPSPLIDRKSSSKTTTKKTQEREPSIRRHSQISWASDTEDDSHISTPNAKVKLPRPAQQQQRKSHPHSSSSSNDNNRRLTTTPTSPMSTAPTNTRPGLASSKHATTTTSFSNPSKDSSGKANLAKSTVKRNKNANRKVHSRRGGGGEVDAPELCAKIEQLRRDAYREERVKKGTAAVVAGERR